MTRTFTYECARCHSLFETGGGFIEVVHCPTCGQEYTVYRPGEGS